MTKEALTNNDNTNGIDPRSKTVIKLDKEIATAANQLRAGEIVAFPTETVYGLGADVTNINAINQVFNIKERPKNHPLIVHFADVAKLQYWAQEIPESAWKLASYFWPGPLTLILKRSRHVPSIVTGGQNTVGLRIPNHPVALALLKALGAERAIAAPSANRFGRISPTTAAHVRDEFNQKLSTILDGGTCQIGLESTIVSFHNETTTVLRPGGIPLPALETVLEKKVSLNNKKSTIRAPGTQDKHYAPTTQLDICPTQAIWQHAQQLEAQNLSSAVLTWSFSKLGHTTINNCVQHLMPRDSNTYGSKLYATLRQFDKKGFDRLLVEMPPDNPLWLAVTDRLQRASQTISQL